jgi:hypothetical protein
MLNRRRPLNYTLPWLTFDAIRALRQEIRAGLRILEFGSEHSTLFWAKHGVDIHSVEDDRGWFELLELSLVDYPNATTFCAFDEEGFTGKIGQMEGQFDVIVVDGSYRKACVTAALAYLRPGGLLVVDNTDWHWANGIATLIPARWQRSTYPGWAPFIGHRSETTIWKAPKVPSSQSDD